MAALKTLVSFSDTTLLHAVSQRATVAVLDLDETVLHLVSGVGRPKWWHEADKTHGDAALEAWWRVQLTEQPALTDPRGICEFFDVARTAGTPVLALTARDGTMRERTREQLCALGVTFSPVPLKAGAPVSPCMCTLKADAPR